MKSVPLPELATDAMMTAVLNLIQVGNAATVFLELTDKDVEAGKQSSSALFTDLLAGANDASKRLRKARVGVLKNAGLENAD